MILSFEIEEDKLWSVLDIVIHKICYLYKYVKSMLWLNEDSNCFHLSRSAIDIMSTSKSDHKKKLESVHKSIDNISSNWSATKKIKIENLIDFIHVSVNFVKLLIVKSF